MVWNSTIKWVLACLWVGLPILGWLPGAPVRLSTQWLSVLASLAIIGVNLSKERKKTPFGWLILACLILALLHYRQPTSAYVWACQSIILLTATSMLVGISRQLQKIVIICAWIQIAVMVLQHFDVNMPFARLHPGDMVGTLGSIRPAFIVIALASLWSFGTRAWILSLVAFLSGSGTIVPVIAFRRWWPYRKRPFGWIAGIGLVLFGLKLSKRWLFALSERFDIWKTWSITWQGIGFRAFPGGFQDDTPLGRAMFWRDSHNVFLDWIGRFGFPGFLVLAGLIIWILRRKQDLWTLLFMAWIACFQSFEQFPVLIILFLVWLIGLCEGEQNAVD